MTQAAETFDKYDAVGNREDLSDIIFDISPSETPILSAIKKGKASNTLHEWQTDAIGAAAANANIEGDDNQDATALTATTRLTNQTQILKYKAIVSGTQEKGMDHAGVKSEMSYQEAKLMKRMKLDCELSILDGGNVLGIAKVAGNATTARKMGSLATYLTTNVSVGATGAAATGNSVDALTAGTDRTFTDTLLNGVLQTQWTAGGDATIMAVSAVNKGVVSAFDGGSTRYIDTNTRELIQSIDVFIGDFHTLKVVPCRNMIGDNVYIIDPNYLKLADLRPLHSYDLAKTGDNFKREMVWETTLEVCNEAAQGLIADTDG